MDSSDLAAFIAAHRIKAEIIHMAGHTPTVETAAQALGVPVSEIGKSILFLAEAAPVLVIANGLNRIDYKRLADHLALPRKRVRMATADEVMAIAGYGVGAMPPFGHKRPLRTIMDARIFDLPEIFVGGGEINAMLKTTPPEIERVAGAERVEITTQT